MAPARDDRSPVRFFLLVFALSTPLWVLGAVSRRRIRDRRWYLPIVLLQPAVYPATYGVLWLAGMAVVVAAVWGPARWPGDSTTRRP